MLTNRSMPPGTVIPELPYSDVVAAAKWLCTAFGFAERLRIGAHRVQLSVGNASIVIVERGTGGSSTASSRVMVRVANVDAHRARAAAAGAHIDSEPTDYPYGERQYSALDLEGHRWKFSQSIADADPASWGGEAVRLEESSANEFDPRPAVWVAHVVLETHRMAESAQFMCTIGMRTVYAGADAGVFELRGGTHLILIAKSEVAPGDAPFDLMVEDLHATHRHFTTLGLAPTAIEAVPAFEHELFRVREPAGHLITFYSSHVAGRAV
ncbi:MAG: VOC family protein [Steroidobacteraceae bacterium]